MTLLGLRPAAVAPPVAIMLYYPDRDFGNIEESYAPPPPTGAGMAQGGFKSSKKISPEPVFLYLVFELIFFAQLKPKDFNKLGIACSEGTVLSPNRPCALCYIIFSGFITQKDVTAAGAEALRAVDPKSVGKNSVRIFNKADIFHIFTFI